jgi:L,D-transpeptidase ErfK/SrfK
MPVPPEPARPIRSITGAQTVIPDAHHLPGLIGYLQQHRIERGETLLDTARNAGLGFQEVQDANPTLDEWVPTPGAEAIVPSRWIIPRSHYRGLIINIAEMRLYMFPTRVHPGESVYVRTWPVGIGTAEAPSPVGPFTVRSKERNPTWVVPPSILRTMDEPRAVVPPGPDNPLGAYRIRLSKGLYSIHGTDVPWSVGRLTTHGCIRLYPEHISKLFRLVKPGMPGELVYQPVKFGEQGGQIYVEVHRDLYHRIRNLDTYALAQAKRAGIAERIDMKRLHAAVRERSGVPVAISSDDAGTAVQNGARAAHDRRAPDSPAAQ